MKRFLIFILVLVLFIGCKRITDNNVEKKTDSSIESSSQEKEKKAVDKEIDVLFKGEIETLYSDKNGNHPFNVVCRIRTYSDCPELKIYYRHSNEDEWILGCSSENATNISSSRIELKKIVSFYPKKSIYFKIDLEDEELGSFGKWLPKEDWQDDFEFSYTVYE